MFHGYMNIQNKKYGYFILKISSPLLLLSILNFIFQEKKLKTALQKCNVLRQNGKAKLTYSLVFEQNNNLIYII